MSSNTLLLISSNPNDVTFSLAVAAVAGLTVENAPNIATAISVIDQKNPRVIFSDLSSQKQYQEFEDTVQKAFGLFSDKIHSNSIHFLCSDHLESVPYLMQSPLFGHFVTRSYEDPTVAGQSYGRIVKATLGDRAFGLAGIMKDGTKIQSIKLSVSTQKNPTLEAIKNFLLSAKFQSRMAALIVNAVDELLLNAIYDAPTDNLGKQLYISTSRTKVIQLDGRSEVEVQIAFDGEYVAISAIDQFGSLDRQRLLAHISKNYVNEEYKLRTSVAGAGLGLATVFRTGGSFLFVCDAGTRTEVTVLFKKAYKKYN